MKRRQSRKAKRKNCLKIINELTNRINNNKTNHYTRKITPRNKQPTKEWMTESSIKTTGITKLHYEIVDYVNYIMPSKDESISRNEIVILIEKLIKKINKDWKTKLFGSFSQGLCTTYSDLDIVIINNDPKNSISDIEMLEKIESVINRSHFFKNTISIMAKVPIIKTRHKQTKVMVDISVNKINGIDAAKLIRNVITPEPLLKYTIVLLKVLLRKQKLIETYQGGMSSFLLFSIVYFYYQYELKPENEKIAGSDWISLENDDTDRLSNLGSFLIGVLKFYSEEFDENKYGISLIEQGKLLEKHLIQNDDITNDLLYVENFQEANRDIGRQCTYYPQIKFFFKECMNILLKAKGNSQSYLTELGLGSKIV